MDMPWVYQPSTKICWPVVLADWVGDSRKVTAALISAAEVMRRPRSICSVILRSFSLGSWTVAEPGFVGGRHYFCGDDGVCADAIREQFDRPLAGEGELCALGGGIAGRAALPVTATLELATTRDPRDSLSMGSA